MELLDKILKKVFQLFLFFCNLWCIFIILCLLYQGVKVLKSYL